MTEQRAQYEAVPVAVPRRYFYHWMQVLWINLFGYTLGTKQPFRWCLYRELSERERMKMLEELNHDR